ncbi:hypothetical protein LSTR_LSTR000289 [Laodelphax striatellus]|uniref:non-specific protein-tyrosine kinase n=1 Tax=Laodelphax striatellus TaxID=195883 RepID=A0A482X6N3_LAOST|nr:hypothetical protein LSTR_LSTR000289 [Laodelphax striatellus]WJZ50409.1 tyrosine-protein kinase hopscotch [Laodelphax striatellus]
MEKYVTVHTSLEPERLTYKIKDDTFAEDILIKCCRELKIGPICRHVFALRIRNGEEFISPGVVLALSQTTEFELRIRFKLPAGKSFRKLDLNAYNYYFHQVRNDIIDNRISDISYDKYKDELVGLAVTDMYRVIVETGNNREVIENDYKTFIPKEIKKRHYFRVKKLIRNSLTTLINCNYNSERVRSAYLSNFEDMAPNYLCEQYEALIDDAGKNERRVILIVDPYHRDQPGLRCCYDGKSEYHHLCSIEELCFISVNMKSFDAEISRKSGIPIYLRFETEKSFLSFMGLLDGYYRLMVIWTFNLCNNFQTPSLQSLNAIKCHGPVGGEFSYAKLSEKRNNEEGCFILRESETAYDTYYMDVCTNKSSKPTSYKIEMKGPEDYIFDGGMSYPSIKQLIASLRQPDSSIALKECLPPSEYDDSPLLLCKTVDESVDVFGFNISGSVRDMNLNQPNCINTKQLQVYKGRKKEGHRKMTVVYRGVYKYQKNKKMDVALKVLKPEHNSHLPEFLELAGKWAFIHPSAIVKLLGVTMYSPVSMVTEYFPLGTLDQYLRKNIDALQVVDLVEASTCLATAVWHLKEGGIVHGNIRCRKLLVAAHTPSTFCVRLSDPGLPSLPYSSADIPWIPVECYGNVKNARKLPESDMWAMGTTLWEIFSYGSSPPTDNPEEMITFYRKGKRLPMPGGCLNTIYDIMLSCWNVDVHHRKKAQEAVRDINRIWYQVFNSRRVNSYAPVQNHYASLNIDNTEASMSNGSLSVTENLTSLLSMSEASSRVDWMGGVLVNQSNGWGEENQLLINDSRASSSSQLEINSIDVTSILSQLDSRAAPNSEDSVTRLQLEELLELNGKYNVVLNGKIGQGNYGEVYRGTMAPFNDCDRGKGDGQLVAVKKLISTDFTADIHRDFMREITIMQCLKHPNIVEIKGVISEGHEISLVMEYVKHGSLESYLKHYRDILDPYNHLLKFALDIAQGMKYLGERNIVHRDLAARNILVANEFQVKISDFGLAQTIGNNDYYIIKTRRYLPIKWYAPESLRNGKYSTRTDVWSYGVTLFEMFSLGEEPRLRFGCDGAGSDQPGEILWALDQGVRLPCPDPCPKHIYAQLMHPCWKSDPHDRPTFDAICRTILQLRSRDGNNCDLIQFSSGTGSA